MNTDTLRDVLRTTANSLERLSGAVLEAANVASDTLDRLSEVLDNYVQDMEPGGTDEAEPKPAVSKEEALNRIREALREEYNRSSRRSAHWEP